ncbi:MAG: YggS family pyridoxal phosphate-dependent enzyme [Candidatus Omnitrophota bacterium]
MIAKNIECLTQRVARCCEKSGRTPEEVKIVVVTKTAAAGQIEEVIKSGMRILGENRVQDALSKYALIGERAEWHLIGHLQTNKAKDAVRTFSLIHSVDSVRIAQAINREAAKLDKIQDVLVQVNVSGETTKFGIAAKEAEGFIKEVALYPNIKIKGLMTIAPETANPEEVRPYFRALRELSDTIDEQLILSMGMTNDFEVAIEEGSNMIRIGRFIFAKI